MLEGRCLQDDLLVVWKDKQGESKEPLKVMEENESAQFLCVWRTVRGDSWGSGWVGT